MTEPSSQARGESFYPADVRTRTDPHRRWCIFTGAGHHNALRLWLKSEKPRRWDLVVGYYGDDDQEYSEITRACSFACRAKGGKFQLLKKLVAHHPNVLDQYSHVWVCDDDIQMSAAQIDKAFAITESCGFWVAQPAYQPEGNNFHPITVYAGRHCDYRIVNFIEVGTPIFRRDKLKEFLAVYDGSLTGWGIDYWFMNYFGANELGWFANLSRKSELGRFAIIDKVQVANPHNEEKGGREIDRLQSWQLRRASWIDTKTKYGLVEFRHRVFASCKILSHRPLGVTVTNHDVARQIAAGFVQRFVKSLEKFRVRGCNALMDFRFRVARALSRDERISVGMPTEIPSPRTLAERLGYNPATRLLIVHADDLGVAHAVNAALVKGLETGLINSGSVMVPCPWFPEVAAFARAHPEADLGIHLTLTSERVACRWGPTAPLTRVSSLIDRQGYFHRTWANAHINSRDVEIELRAQIEKAYEAGLRPTHLDSHQYRLQMSGQRIFEIYLRLGRKYNLPIFVSRDWFPQFPYLQHSLSTRDIVIDRTVTVGSDIVPQQWPTFYRRAIESLQPGVTQFVIHPGLNNEELKAWSAHRPAWGAAWRQRDFDFFTSNEFRTLLSSCDIHLVTWREIGKLLRKN